AYVHGRTVPTPLRRLLLHAYLPGLAGIALVGIAASAAGVLLGDSPRALTATVAATACLLVLYGALFVLERDDRDQAWT
ncbi:hypothetical protein FPK46_36765, partial [Acinetobacter baumannii]|nr:hypothetical protein [Acinetobacter baumannii]